MCFRKFQLLAGVLLVLIFFTSCNKKQTVDSIFYNAVIYTVDSINTVANSMVVKDGKIVAVGDYVDIGANYKAKIEVDLHGKSVYPGFIDAHCHFYGYAMNLQQVDLMGTSSFKEVLQRVKDFSVNHKLKWIQGRGWDQNRWPVKEFPDKIALDSLFPDIPVCLTRVDGHAVLVNTKALQIAGITEKTKVSGGSIILKGKQPSGVLIDNAVDIVKNVIPKPKSTDIAAALLQAQQNCFAVGLTTLDDAGLDGSIILMIDSLQKAGSLKMRIYAMLNPNKENKEIYYKSGPYKTDRLNVCAFKIYADGALGSRGACLLKPYYDKPKETGFLLKPFLYYDTIAHELYEHGFQMNTHCIGDSANRVILNVYGSVLKEKNNKRWRIEHAQVVNNDDVSKFANYSIIPSVQPTHATSDMYWAGERLGSKRLQTAYSYKTLLQQNNMIASGSDFPIEGINPMYGFYAAVVRKDKRNYPENGFQMENAISREQALRSMTIWAAYSNFEEKEKGSIEQGKFADFVVLEEDIMKMPAGKLFQAKVKSTFINGEKVY